MFSFNNKKLLLISSLLILTLFNITKASLIPNNFAWKYDPIKQPEDQQLAEKRKNFAYASSNHNMTAKLQIFPNNTIIKKFSSSSRPGVCYNWAIKKTCKLTKKQFGAIEELIVGCQDWVEIIGMPYNFFDQIKDPQPNCLATYTCANNNFDIPHMAVVAHNSYQLISKYGIHDFIMQHDAWEIDHIYGDQIYFWQLKKEYYNDPTLLFTTLCGIINKSHTMKKELNEWTQTFLTSNDYDKNYKLLKMIVGLDINARNRNNQTALMLAAQKGNMQLINLYIQHDANINYFDNNGHTALSLAEHNNHYDIVALLKEKADISLSQDLVYDFLKIVGIGTVIGLFYAITIKK